MTNKSLQFYHSVRDASPIIYSFLYKRCINLLNAPTSTTHIQTRSKHSKTQLKRLFQRNPARLRVSQRNEALKRYSDSDKPIYRPIFQPVFLPNGWSAPPTPEDIALPNVYENKPNESDINTTVLKRRDEIPFAVNRTGGKSNGAAGFLPVYSSLRLGGTKKTTTIRKVFIKTGDTQVFVKELKAVLGLPPEDDQSIRLRASGMAYEVDGDRTREIKNWLAGLGF